MGGSCSKRQPADSDSERQNPELFVKHVNPLQVFEDDDESGDADVDGELFVASLPSGAGISSAVLNEIDDFSSEPPTNAGLDQEAEEEAAAQAEAKLLPLPEEVMLWIEHRYSTKDDAMMKEQGAKAVEWLVQVLLAAWCSERLKKHGRRLLAVREFTANLRFMELWHKTTTVSNTSVESNAHMLTSLMEPICDRLNELGYELERNYVDDRLHEWLGGLTLPLHPVVVKKGKGNARQGLCVPTPPPGWHGRPKHRGEFVYLQVLLMVAAAVNDTFHQWCRDTLGDTISELQTPPIKSYGRMRNKMFSAEDHRFRDYPRPEWNVDINRVLAIAKDPESMIRAAEALSNAYGGVAKQKNGFSLPEAEAALQYHLRLMMVSVMFGMTAPDGSGRVQTYSELANDPRVRTMWDEYAKKPPQAGEPGCEWDADVAAARAWLESKKVGKQPVLMISEVQIVLPLTCEVRHKMHELYKVARADTDKQLYLDFKIIADKEKRVLQAEYDDATALRRACRTGDLAQVQQIADAAVEDDLDDAFTVACRHGQVDIMEMELMQPSRQRVDWNAADDTLALCERPSLPALEILFGKSDWSWVPTERHQQQHRHHHHPGHTLLHTACREGHTDVVELCIQHRADVNARRETDGCTGLYLAAQYGHVPVVEALLRANADHSLHQKVTDASPLYTAAESGHNWIVECLIGAKANLSHESQDRPAHLIAANNGHKDVVQLLTAQNKKRERQTKKAAQKARSAGLIASVGAKKDLEDQATSGSARRAAMIRRRNQQEAGVASRHIMEQLATQLNATFEGSGMTKAQLFQTFEKDGDGSISREEFGRMLKTLGAEIPEHTVDHIFTMLDADAGGSIGMAEFLAWTEGQLQVYAGTKSNLVDAGKHTAAASEADGRILSMAQTKEAT